MAAATMIDPIGRLWKWSGRPTETSRRWTVLVTGSLIALGLVVYNNDRADDRRENERIAAAAADAVYLSQLQARSACENRVSSREDFRRFATGVYDYFERFGASGTVSDLREILDADFPVLLLADCPPAPEPPIGL